MTERSSISIWTVFVIGALVASNVCFVVLWFHESSSQEEEEEMDARSAVDIGSRYELFVDDFLINKINGLSLKTHEPRREETVLKGHDVAWEGSSSAYYSVIDDQGTLKMIYRGFSDHDLSKNQVTCLSESKDDGKTFQRPKLKLFDFDGDSNNNIVWKGVESHNLAPFLDTNPAVDKSERFKALGGLDADCPLLANDIKMYWDDPNVSKLLPGKEYRWGLHLFVSNDGIHWKRKQQNAVLKDEPFDSLNTCFFDETIGKYRLYSRYWAPCQSSDKLKGGKCFDPPELAGKEPPTKFFRSLRLRLSKDLINWEDPIDLDHDFQLYTNAATRCPDAPHIILMFPMRFDKHRRVLSKSEMIYPGVSDAILMTSRDGVTFKQSGSIQRSSTFLRPGNNQQNWGQRSNQIAHGIVQRGNQWTLFNLEEYQLAGMQIRRLTMLKHRLVSIHNDGIKPGTMITRPIHFSGDELLINFATSAAGFVKVCVVDSDHLCATRYGDLIDEVILKGLKELKQPIRLRIDLLDGDVWSLKFN